MSNHPDDRRKFLKSATAGIAASAAISSAMLGLPLNGIAQTAPAGHARVFDVEAFGAKGDGVTLDTPAINRAIEAAAAAGGGPVNFPRNLRASSRQPQLLDGAVDRRMSERPTPSPFAPNASTSKNRARGRRRGLRDSVQGSARKSPPKLRSPSSRSLGKSQVIGIVRLLVSDSYDSNSAGIVAPSAAGTIARN